MKWTLAILIFLFGRQEDATVLTGTVSVDREPLAGCRIKVIENGTTRITDSQGQFRIEIDALKTISLSISYLDRLTCTVLIEDIVIDQNYIDLGQIPLFFNQMIEIGDYEALDLNKKQEYDEIRHWTQLIGYISKNKTDTVALRTALLTERGIKYRFDSLDNTVVINYRDWTK